MFPLHRLKIQHTRAHQLHPFPALFPSISPHFTQQTPLSRRFHVEKCR